MLRPQSGNEHELTDPFTSFCWLPVVPVLRYTVCAENKHVLLLVCGTGTAGCFVFPLVRGVFLQGRAGSSLSVVSCLFLPPCVLTGFLCVWNETVNLKVNTSVDDSDCTK